MAKTKHWVKEHYPDIHSILTVPTPKAWLQWAEDNVETLLWDHGNCEKKAASTAMALLYRYPEHSQIAFRMSRLAREELRHFEQVHRIIQARQYPHRVVLAAKYAARLRKGVRSHEPARLVDQLIMGAFIEARSCERFGAIAPLLDAELTKFYFGLMAAEARHFHEYLELAAGLCEEQELHERVAHFAQSEAQAITTPDEHFAFHSGPPRS